MVRIRYTTNNEGTVLLSKDIESASGVFRSQIRRTESGWVSNVLKLIGDGAWSELEGTSSVTKNLAVAKAKAKRSLKELGVHFLDEVRRRGATNGE